MQGPPAYHSTSQPPIETTERHSQASARPARPAAAYGATADRANGLRHGNDLRDAAHAAIVIDDVQGHSVGPCRRVCVHIHGVGRRTAGLVTEVPRNVDERNGFADDDRRDPPWAAIPPIRTTRISSESRFMSITVPALLAHCRARLGAESRSPVAGL